MSTDTEALRQAFERRMQQRGWKELHLERDGLDYTRYELNEAWHAFQAGHAAAKAETADVGEPVAFAHFAENGNIRLWAPERPRDLDGNAAQPLYTADQLAAAVAKERERWAAMCADIAQSYGGVAAGPMATERGKLVHESMAAGALNCADAIRAGAKGEPS